MNIPHKDKKYHCNKNLKLVYLPLLKEKLKLLKSSIEFMYILDLSIIKIYYLILKIEPVKIIKFGPGN